MFRFPSANQAGRIDLKTKSHLHVENTQFFQKPLYTGRMNTRNVTDRYKGLVEIQITTAERIDLKSQVHFLSMC